jgi:hypothetical protein
MTDVLSHRLEMLRTRLRTAYDGIGHSSGRPYVYVVYPPAQERAVRLLAADTLRSDDSICFHSLDLLPLTIEALRGEEALRRDLLGDPRTPGAAGDILRLWADELVDAIAATLAAPRSTGRPVIVLSGLAALHPLGNPTALMEGIAEQEPRDPATNRMLPIVLLVPGTRPAGTSRRYRFLGLERLTLDFYRGEEL